MKVKVYSNHVSISISGNFEGKSALQFGRSYAASSSFITQITLEYGTKREIYDNGELTKSYDLKEAQEAANFIARYSDYSPNSLIDKSNLAKAYKQAAKRLHPDQNKDEHDAYEKFLQLKKSKEILEQL